MSVCIIKEKHILNSVCWPYNGLRLSALHWWNGNLKEQKEEPGWETMIIN